MTLTAAAFVQLAAMCGPSVHVETLAAVARAESGFDPLAIHDNATGRTYRPASLAEAIQLAGDLITVYRHSVDLGLMQVNSANLPGLRLSIADSFDPCKNIGAGARVLVAGYQAPAAGLDAQPALLQALSRYNTGKPDRGFVNGYVRRVQYAAGQIVPAIRLAGSPQSGEGQRTRHQPLRRHRHRLRGMCMRRRATASMAACKALSRSVRLQRRHHRRREQRAPNRRRPCGYKRSVGL